MNRGPGLPPRIEVMSSARLTNQPAALLDNVVAGFPPSCPSPSAEHLRAVLFRDVRRNRRDHGEHATHGRLRDRHGRASGPRLLRLRVNRNGGRRGWLARSLGHPALGLRPTGCRSRRYPVDISPICRAFYPTRTHTVPFIVLPGGVGRSLRRRCPSRCAPVSAAARLRAPRRPR